MRKRIHRFNACGLDGLADNPKPGRPRRLTEHERSQIIALVATTPPGRLNLLCETPTTPPADQPPTWTLDTLTAAAQAAGIQVGRSHVRRILLREGARWRQVRTWAGSTDPAFVPKGTRSWASTPTHRRKRP